MHVQTLSELLDFIEQGNRTKLRDKHEARGPEVGIFWVIDNEVYLDTTPVREAENYGDFKVHDVDHFSYWEDQLSSSRSPIHLQAKGKDYDYFPRGRTVYAVDEDKYYVYVDKCIDKTMVNKVISLMRLPLAKVEVKYDRHYQCAKCDKNYVQV